MPGGSAGLPLWAALLVQAFLHSDLRAWKSAGPSPAAVEDACAARSADELGDLQAEVRALRAEVRSLTAAVADLSARPPLAVWELAAGWLLAGAAALCWGLLWRGVTRLCARRAVVEEDDSSDDEAEIWRARQAARTVC